MTRVTNVAALAGAFAFAAGFNPAEAHLQGATYDYSISGGTLTGGAGSGTATDPANPGFCIGPNSGGCGANSGVSVSFGFADTGAGAATITFQFSGSTAIGASASTFTVDLSNFATTDGEQIKSITLASGALQEGSLSGSWNGTDAIFNGSPNSSGFYSNIGGSSVVFDVSLTSATSAPEPASIALLGAGLAGLGTFRRRRRA